MEALAKYLLAVIRDNSNDEESLQILISKLQELANNELDACFELLTQEEKEWGETAVRVNRITGKLRQELLKRKG